MSLFTAATSPASSEALNKEVDDTDADDADDDDDKGNTTGPKTVETAGGVVVDVVPDVAIVDADGVAPESVTGTSVGERTNTSTFCTINAASPPAK